MTTRIETEDVVERLHAYDVPNSGSRDGQGFLDEVADTIERLREENARGKARYTWLANAVLACDYGDNEMGGADTPDRIGWCVRFTRRNGEPFIFGQSIDAAIDAALTPSADDDK